MLDKITKVAKCVSWILTALGTAISIVITIVMLPKILTSCDSTYNSLKDNDINNDNNSEG